MINLDQNKTASSSCNAHEVRDPMTCMPMVTISLRLPRKTSDSMFEERKKIFGKIGTWNTFLMVFGSWLLNSFSAAVARGKVSWVLKATVEEHLPIHQYMSQRNYTMSC